MQVVCLFDVCVCSLADDVITKEGQTTITRVTSVSLINRVWHIRNTHLIFKPGPIRFGHII